MAAQVVNEHAKDYTLNVTQGISEIGYFTTMADRPTASRVQTIAKTSTSLTFKWTPIVTERELIEYYYVDVFVQPDHDLLNHRNYCKYPREEPINAGISEPKKIAPCNVPPRPDYAYGYDDMIVNENGERVRPNISKSELYEWKQQRKLDCLLWRERHTFDHMLTSFLDGHAEDECDANDATCDLEFNSMRFKRELDMVVSPPDNRADNFVDSVIDTVYHIDTRSFSVYQTNGTVDGLHPYTLYTMHFFSCNSKAKCSSYYFHSQRTDIDPAADNVMFEVIDDDEAANIKHLQFELPENPNGLTVAFVIEHHDLVNNNLTETCITPNEHKSRSHRYHNKWNRIVFY